MRIVHRWVGRRGYLSPAWSFSISPISRGGHGRWVAGCWVTGLAKVTLSWSPTPPRPAPGGHGEEYISAAGATAHTSMRPGNPAVARSPSSATGIPIRSVQPSPVSVTARRSTSSPPNLSSGLPGLLSRLLSRPAVGQGRQPKSAGSSVMTMIWRRRRRGSPRACRRSRSGCQPGDGRDIVSIARARRQASRDSRRTFASTSPITTARLSGDYVPAAGSRARVEGAHRRRQIIDRNHAARTDDRTSRQHHLSGG